jgi:membrane protein DedA with SNARE-associated domain
MTRRPLRGQARSKTAGKAASVRQIAERGNRAAETARRRLHMIGFANFDFVGLAKFLSLLFLPFAHEDLAIVLGGYIVVNDLMPVGIVAALIYGGMVVSDFALYGIGAAARSLPWLSRWAVDDNVKNFGDTLKRNLFGLVALCRIVPGVVFIALVACGWTRVPFGRFTVASLLVSALYLPLMLYLVIVFGDALDNHVGLWTWPLLLGLIVIAGFMRYRVFTLHESAPATGPADALLRRRPLRAGSLFHRLRGPQSPRLGAPVPRAAKWLGLS